MTISVKLLEEKFRKKFNDESYLEHIDYRLSEKLSELVVRKNGVYTYQSEVLKGKKLLMSCFRHMMKMRTFVMWHFNKGGDYQTLVKQIIFPTVRAMNTVYPFLTSLNQIVPQLKMFAIELFAAVFSDTGDYKPDTESVDIPFCCDTA